MFVSFIMNLWYKKGRGDTMNQKVMLINVEVVTTSYIEKFKKLHYELANENFIVPDDFFESAISAAYDQKEKVNYRYPRFNLFNDNVKALYDVVNEEIHPNNEQLAHLVNLAKRYDYHVVFIFDQYKAQGKHLIPLLTHWVSDALVLFSDQSLQGKPDPHLYVRAIKHFNASANDALVIDSSRNGIQASHLTHSRCIYIDKGLGISEKIFKYSTYQAENVVDVERILLSIKSEK